MFASRMVGEMKYCFAKSDGFTVSVRQLAVTTVLFFWCFNYLLR
jgi:hypothetical protein